MFTVPSYVVGNSGNFLKDYTTPTMSIGNKSTFNTLQANTTPNVPTGTANGDLMIWSFGISGITLATPTGFTLLTSVLDTRNLYIFYRIANSEPASYASVHASAWVSGGIITLKPEVGKTMNTPTYLQQSNASIDPAPCPSMSGIANSILLCNALSISGNWALTGNPNPAMTEQWELDASSFMTNYLMTQLLTKTKNTGIKYVKAGAARTTSTISILVTQT